MHSEATERKWQFNEFQAILNHR